MVLTLQPEGEINSALWGQAQPFLIAIPIIIAVGTCLMAVTAWKLYDEFAWTIYKHISADLRMKRRYLTYQVYIALLKFDFFFFLGFTVQFVVIVPKGNVEFGLTIAAMPVTVLILLAAAWFVRKENRAGTIGVIVSFRCLQCGQKLTGMTRYSILEVWDTSSSSSIGCTNHREEISTLPPEKSSLPSPCSRSSFL